MSVAFALKDVPDPDLMPPPLAGFSSGLKAVSRPSSSVTCMAAGMQPKLRVSPLIQLLGYIPSWRRVSPLAVRGRQSKMSFLKWLLDSRLSVSIILRNAVVSPTFKLS